jgi:hypothetical protein
MNPRYSALSEIFLNIYNNLVTLVKTWIKVIVSETIHSDIN